MNSNQNPLSEEQIHAYVDGQLDHTEREAIEKLLASDTEAAARVAAYQEQNHLMQQLFNPVLDEPVPSRLSQPIKKKTTIRWGLAANIALLLIGSLLGWVSRGSFNPTTHYIASLPQLATVAHVVYAPEVKHPVEVTVEHEAHLVKWLSKRLGKNVRAPDLTQLGFNLIGGRLLPADDGPAAQFLYEDSVGNRMTLYVHQNPGEDNNTAFRYQEQDGNKVFYWIDGNLGYALTASIDKQRLLDAANGVYHALSF